MLRKIISVATSLMMILTLLMPVDISAAADPADSLIFDLDLSNGIKDSAGNTSAAAGGVSLPTVQTEASSGIKYLELRRVSGDKKVAVFEKNAFETSDELTFEVWFNAYNTNGGRLFTMSGNNNAGQGDTCASVVFNSNKGFSWCPGDDQDNGPEAYKIASNVWSEGEWTHAVFTRKWVQDSGAATGKWIGEVYINGEKIGDNTENAVSAEKYTSPQASPKYLAIGARTSGAAGFYGSIADFKVYTGDWGEEVSSNYALEAEKFDPIAVSSVEYTTANTDKTVLEADGGNIEIKFSREVEESTLSNITFANTNGLEDADMEFEITLDNTDKKLAKLTYKRLSFNADTPIGYKLTIPTTVSSVGGKSNIVTAKEYNYTSVGKEFVLEPQPGSTILHTDKEMILTFTKAVDAATIENITFNRTDGTAPQKAGTVSMVDGNDAQVKITFDDDIVFSADSPAEYKLNIGSGVLSDLVKWNYAGTNEYTFTVVEDVMALESISPDNGELSTTGGKITLDFDKTVDYATLTSELTLDNNGLNVPIVASVNKEDNSKVEISYGKLEADASYTLTIGGIKAANGANFKDGDAIYKVFNFIAISAPIFYEDFSGYTPGTKPLDEVNSPKPELQFRAMSNSSINTNTNLDSTVVVKSEGGINYLSMNGGGILDEDGNLTNSTAVINKNNRILIVFPEAISEKAFVSEVKVRPNADTEKGGVNSAARNVMRFVGPSNEEVVIGNMNGTYVGANKTASTYGAQVVQATGTFNFETADSSGFYNVKVTFEPINEIINDVQVNSKLTLENALAPEEGKAVYKTKLSSVKQIEICHLYPQSGQGNDQSTYVFSEVAGINMYYITVPAILEDKIENVEKNAETIQVVFNDSINPRSLSNDCFTLTDPDGNIVRTEYTVGAYDEATRTATITLKENLSPGVDYTLSLNNITSQGGITGTSEITVTAKPNDVALDGNINGSGIDFDNITGATVYSSSVTVENNSNAPADCAIALLLYKDEVIGIGESAVTLKRLYDVRIVQSNNIASGASPTLSVDTTGIDLTGVTKIKTVVWKNEGSELSALGRPLIVKKAQ